MFCTPSTKCHDSHVIKTANHLLQYCVTNSWWNCFANDLLKLQALKIRTLYSFYHDQQKTWAQLCLYPQKSLKKFSNKSGLVTIPSLCSPAPPYMSWMEKGEKKVWFTPVNLNQKWFGNYNEGAVMHWKTLHHPRQFWEHSWVIEHNIPFKQTKQKSKQSKAGKCFPSNKTGLGTRDEVLYLTEFNTDRIAPF